MRSLSTKLALAFAIISVVGIVLAALFVRQLVTNEFDSYVRTQRMTTFQEDLTTFYASNGTWNGLAETLRNQQQISIQLGSTQQIQPAHGPDQFFEFVLADTSGTVVYAVNPLLRGTQIDPANYIESSPVAVNGQTVGTVYVLAPPKSRNPAEARYLARTDIALGSAAAISLVVAILLGLVLARFITRPVRELTSAARAIAEGDLRQQVPVRSRDELGVLATQFNIMSDDLARSNELRRRMTADIAHDLRTPLTVIAGYLEAMRDETLRPTAQRFTTMYDETQVLLRLVQDLHTLSLADAGELPLKRQHIAPNRLLERVATSYQHEASQHNVALHVAAPAALPDIDVDIEQTVRVLSNLVSNALRHTPAGGAITLQAKRRDDRVMLEIADTGQGIAPEHLPNIFERFYRADQSRTTATGGSGLGLAIVRSIVEAHGGQVAAASAPGEGTTFTVMLPVAQPQPV